MPENNEKPSWSRTAVVYQIYPRSFKDSNGDGVGDLRGIAQNLDYLNDGTDKSLGVGAIWLSPFYKSPMEDFGYDISDYCDVDPIFGTLADFDFLIEQARKRDIKVIVDYVPNHTSSQHPWFVQSRTSKDNPKRNWYIWADAKPDGSPPNNWLSVFGGSGWELDPLTGQYYFHSFLKQQPDLNWQNPEVREAMANVLEFWLERGVDGFRMDAVHHLVKDSQLRDDPLNPEYIPGKQDPYQALRHTYSQGQEETLRVINSFCKLMSQYPDRFIVTEVYSAAAGLVPYFKACENGLHSPFNFNLIGLPWQAGLYRQFVDSFEAVLTHRDWPNYVLGNHDKPRVVSRMGKERARLAALMLLTLRGMPFVYYGDELGMEDVPIPPDLVQDPFEKNVPGMGLGRDPQRTPLQWTSEAYAGFSAVPSWLPAGPDFQQRNIKAESLDPHSFLSMYKNLIHLRNGSHALKFGDYRSIGVSNDNIFAYARLGLEEKLYVAVNFSGEEQIVSMEEGWGIMVFSTLMDRSENEKTELSKILLRPYEGVIIKLV